MKDQDRFSSGRRGSENVSDDNVLPFQRPPQDRQRDAGKNPPFINLPPATLALLAVLAAVHAVLFLVLSETARYALMQTFGFVPGRYTGAEAFDWPALVAPVTYSFMHGGWIHLGVNALMLMAFGAGVERWIGPRRMLAIYFGSVIGAALFHLILNPFSGEPAVGASGGLSGLFGALMLLVNARRGGAGGGRNGLLPFIGVWIAITILTGMMGAPGGGAVAWAAHIGGFLTGLAMAKAMRL